MHSKVAAGTYVPITTVFIPGGITSRILSELVKTLVHTLDNEYQSDAQASDWLAIPAGRRFTNIMRSSILKLSL
eukprot:2953109-Pleurochrysis_carterae.AAC.1